MKVLERRTSKLLKRARKVNKSRRSRKLRRSKKIAGKIKFSELVEEYTCNAGICNLVNTKSLDESRKTKKRSKKIFRTPNKKLKLTQ